MLLLPYINASAQRVTLLVGMCAAVCDKVASIRRQRASLVTNVAFAAIFEGKAVPHFMLQHLGSWAFSLSSAHFSNYLSCQAAAGNFATLVRCPGPHAYESATWRRGRGDRV